MPTRVGDRLAVGETPLAVEEAPAAAQRRRRDVERAAGFGMNLRGALEQGEQRAAHFGRLFRGAPVDARELAVLAKDAELRLEPVGDVQCSTRSSNVPGVFAGKDDLEPAGHRAPVDAEPMSVGAERRRRTLKRQELATADRSGRCQLVPRLRCSRETMV
jgi:hypothetical protein